ncbi:MAG: phosphoglycerate kinase [Mycobacteriales bacterium]|nr:MAG: phosphoglycerate kinase [Pseudonocardiales bacterium]
MRTLDDLLDDGVAGRRVLLRSDLNVPLEAGRITDDGRVRASVPVIKRLADAAARVVVCAHLGRPKGAPDPKYSLSPVRARLAELLGAQIMLADDVAGPSARSTVDELAAGGVALLENVRFDRRETSKDEAERAALAAEFAALADVYVDDAFGAVHRKHASVYDIAKMLPHYAGTLVEQELSVLRTLSGDPLRPYVVVLGGSKVSDKLGVIKALLPKVDRLLVGGGMCFTFLAAQGHEIGDSLVERDQIETCAGLLDEAGDRIVLPTDIVIATELTADADTATVAAAEIPPGHKGLDVGPDTVRVFAAALRPARTIFWNGPMGVFEVAPFAAGTKGVAQAVADCAGTTVVGGGDSAAAVRALGLDETAYTHISTGGGASLEFLEGATLPGVAVLED